MKSGYYQSKTISPVPGLSIFLCLGKRKEFPFSCLFQPPYEGERKVQGLDSVSVPIRTCTKSYADTPPSIQFPQPPPRHAAHFSNMSSKVAKRQ